MINDKELIKPEEFREISSIKSDTQFANTYSNLLKNTDPVVRYLGGSLSVYDEILRDPQVKTTFGQLKEEVVSAQWSCEPLTDASIDKQCADALRAEMEYIKYDALTEKMLNALFYGFGVAEVIWQAKDNIWGFSNIKVRDRSRFTFDKECVLRLPDKSKLNDDGKKCTPPYFWVYTTGASHDDEPYGRGLAWNLYWNIKFKRGAEKFKIKFLEKFGQPTILGKFKQGGDSAKLLEAIQSIASDTGVVIPEDMDIMLLEATRSGNAEHIDYIELCDKYTSKILLGQTMTTDDGSSNSQSSTHREGLDKKVDYVARNICESFHDTVATWFTQLNFPNANVPIIARKTKKDDTPAEIAKKDLDIFNFGYKPTQEYMDVTYGKNYEPISQNDITLPAGDTNFLEMAEKILKDQFPDQTELDNAIDSITDEQSQELMMPTIQPILDFAEKFGAKKTLGKLTEVYTNDDIDELTDKLAQMFFVANVHGRTSV